MLYEQECLKKEKKKQQHIFHCTETEGVLSRFRARSCVYSVKLYMNVNTVLFFRCFRCVRIECVPAQPRLPFYVRAEDKRFSDQISTFILVETNKTEDTVGISLLSYFSTCKY